MPSSNLAFTGFFVIALAILAMDYAQDYFEGIFDIHPELVKLSRHTSNQSLSPHYRHRADQHSVNSPLFQAMKQRYRDFRPHTTQVQNDDNIEGINIEGDNDGLLKRYLEENLRGNRTTHVI